ncbi:hypothetical protein L2E82_30546 [Cichorium intybus]|uniref:Uncharacterized protein n=1 Tax=Cichorium intybus TaxID=13427 RepID=A0ACB9D155_CICIN|nr:hypothetical protein L2E82_30546 [Cichorium intybus]
MQSPATMNPIVPTEPMLVPSVINRRHVATEHQQKWRKRTQIVNPLLLLNLHPSLDSTPKKQNFTPVNSKIANSDTSISISRFPPAAGRMDTLNDLLASSDLISLHCALTNDTIQIFKSLYNVKMDTRIPLLAYDTRVLFIYTGAFLVNNGSSQLLDDYAVKQLLIDGTLAANVSVYRWIPDGQLCPTVPNISNYIHWIEDPLSSDIIPNSHGGNNVIKGFNIGTGANCIYPLPLLGWNFVASDVAIEWAERNVKVAIEWAERNVTD